MTNLDRYQYIVGFLSGQAVTYCEQIRAGAKFAAQINCPMEHVEMVKCLVADEGCFSMAEPPELGRVPVWIYQDIRVLPTIQRLQSAPQNEAGIWGMGRLLGYSDAAIARFVQEVRSSH